MQLQARRSIFNSGINGQNTSIATNLFLRYATKKKFAFEFGFSYDQIKSSEDVELDISPYYSLVIDHKRNNYLINFAVQYELSCAHVQSSSFARKFKNYIGISLSPAFVHDNSLHTYDESISEKKSYTDFQCWMGLSNTMTYSVTDQISVLSRFRFDVAPTGRFSRVSPNSTAIPDARASLEAGIIYKLN